MSMDVRDEVPSQPEVASLRAVVQTVQGCRAHLLAEHNLRVDSGIFEQVQVPVQHWQC